MNTSLIRKQSIRAALGPEVVSPVPSQDLYEIGSQLSQDLDPLSNFVTRPGSSHAPRASVSSPVKRRGENELLSNTTSEFRV